eukprot:TRINITY_DN5956_c0_g1_i2.p1 TRINITY_DN5956_c0_g1~~TRINITY_DN5956_c0_g1_i2.p1  ORF type:complete len:237 (-),score=46.21 TRINITY_DN5956_c0_g1_i2:6-716(-)
MCIRDRCLGYIAACAYASLFRFNMFAEYRLFSMRQSDSFSLLFNASMVCRLVPPLGLNFMYLVAVHDSQFERVVVGQSHFDKHFGLVYNFGLPPAVVLLCLVSLVRVIVPELCGGSRTKILDDELSQAAEETELLAQPPRSRIQLTEDVETPILHKLPRRITDTNRSQYGATSLESRFNLVSESPREESQSMERPERSVSPEWVEQRFERRYEAAYGSLPPARSKSSESPETHSLL